MRGTRLPEMRIESAGPPSHGAGWLNLTWKLLIALLIMLVMLVGVPVPQALLASVWAALLLWGALFVSVAGENLFGAQAGLKWLRVALAVGGYRGLPVP